MTVLRTRRSRITGLIGVALAAALLVTGCSAPAEDSKTASSPNSEGSALPAAEGTTTDPLTLESPYGTSVLE
ncbi:MAG: ABC transporter substrate-binding protein, partial [Rhodococcus sp. (in: high G+C Gram-positive bacteria)]